MYGNQCFTIVQSPFNVEWIVFSANDDGKIVCLYPKEKK